MTRIFYKPRLKKGVIGNQKIIPITKSSFTFKRLKWHFVDLEISKTQNFFRNDSLIISNHVLSLRKQYTYRNNNRKSLFVYFSTLKNKELKKGFLEKKKQRNKRQNIDYFFCLLEYRLDFTLVKANFAKSTFQARWLISRGFVSVNKKKTLSSSFILKSGDFVKLSLEKNIRLNPFRISFFQLPLEICFETFSFVVLLQPKIMALGIYPHFFNLGEIVSFFHK